MPAVTEADLFFRHSPSLFKLMHMWLATRSLCSSQFSEKPTKHFIRGLNEADNFPFCLNVVSVWLYCWKRRRRGCLSVLPFAGDNGLLRCSPAAITPLMISSFLFVCSYTHLHNRDDKIIIKYCHLLDVSQNYKLAAVTVLFWTEV